MGVRANPLSYPTDLVFGLVLDPEAPAWGQGGRVRRAQTAQTMGDRSVGAAGRDGANSSHVLFDNFVQAGTCKGTLKAFQELCDHLDVKPTESRIFYHKLKSKLNYWKAKALWAKLDKRACQKEYKKGRACANSKVTLLQHSPQ